MKRRSFINQLGIISGVAVCRSFTAILPQLASKQKSIIKPKALCPGDMIYLIAPASAAPSNKIDEAIRKIQQLGYRVQEGKFLRQKNGFFSGTDAERLADIHEGFSNDTYKGIWCVRGGYGLSPIIDEIDYDLIRTNPKFLIGYSDITALELAIFKHTGLVTFHGPVGVDDHSVFSRSFYRLFKEKTTLEYSLSDMLNSKQKQDQLYQRETITPGKATGRLLGGNLSLIAAMCGTGQLPSFEDKIVFLEDVGEKPYRVDRMLNQVLQATDIHKSAAIIHGIYNDCVDNNSNSQTLLEAIKHSLGHLSMPQGYGFPFGHISEQWTLPQGIKVRVDTENFTFQTLESAVL